MKSLYSGHTILVIVAGLFALTLGSMGCSGPTDHNIEKVGVTVTTPGSWSVDTNNSEYHPRPYAELSADGLRHIKISEKKKSKIESLDMLVKAMEEDHKVLNKESFDNGFGATFEDKEDGEKTFLYVAKLDGKNFRCEPGPYYKQKVLEQAVKICKSMR